MAQTTYRIKFILSLLYLVTIIIFIGEILLRNNLYLFFIILGAGGALMLVTSLGLTADLIGNATNTSAFVYGSMSFTDKLANGLAVIVVEHL